MDRTGIGLLLVCLLCGSTCVLGQDMVNIALGKTYSQISLYNPLRPASHAANNNTGGTYNQYNCIHTAVDLNYYPYPYNTYHWWEVDLGRTYPVHDITVWARDTFNRRLYPFTITVDGQTCVTVPASEAPTGSVRQKSVTCASEMDGQRVRITLQSYANTLNLCEFQVFACNPGFYGNECDIRCDQNNPGCDLCTRQGVCTMCKTGYTGQSCTDCAPGYYKFSNLCYQCSVNCKDRQCDSNTGRCDGCVDGRWGQSCQQTCPDNCNGNSCQRDNGHCYSCAGNFAGDTCTGCARHFVGDTCTGCVDGRHGDRCDKLCTPSGCLRCGQNTGRCETCKANLNLAPPSCTDCADGFYKDNSNTCTQCSPNCKGNCNKVSGTCDNACSDGWYGDNCTAQCRSCEGGVACNKSTGHCPCPAGKQPPLCDTDCKDNKYGRDCLESCGQCQGEQPCDTVTGECPADCLPGWMRTRCDENCKNGTFGERCNKTCGHCEVNTTCHHADGHCLANCASGFTGPSCLQEAKPATSQENKDDGATNLVGPMVGAIVGVGLVMTISITAAICWRRKSATSRSGGQDPTTASSISVKDAAPTVSPEPSPLRQSSSNEDNLYSEIRDPDDTYEISEMQSIYDKPSPYSNDDGDREPYMQLTSKTNDVNIPASNAAYVNTKLSV